MKKQKGAGGQGESPMRVRGLSKKSRVESYIFFSPFSLELLYDIYMILVVLNLHYNERQNDLQNKSRPLRKDVKV